MITRYGSGLLVCGVLSAVLGRVFGVIEMYVAAGGLVALTVISVLIVVLSRVRLQVSRSVQPSRVFAGEPAVVEVTVHNAGWRTSPVVRLHDPVAGTSGATLSVTPLRRREDARAAYRFPSERRGRVLIGPMRAERRDPFGLAVRRSTISTMSEVLVYPHWQVLDFPDRWVGAGPLAELMRRRMLARGTDEFHSLRNYTPGDDLRRVHWKHSARSDDLKVKQTDPTAVQRIAIVLDVDRRNHDVESFEAAASAAASFALSADRAGFRIHATTNAIAGSASEDLDDFLETLALAEPAATRPLGLALAEVARWLEGGMIVVVTGRSSPDALSAVRASAPGADATIVTLCDRTAQASTSEGVLGSSFVLDGSTPAALEQTWRRLVGVTTESGVAT